MVGNRQIDAGEVRKKRVRDYEPLHRRADGSRRGEKGHPSWQCVFFMLAQA